MDSETFVIADRKDADLDLTSIRIRRCTGCVKCLTERSGECAVKDDFSPIIPIILSRDKLVIEMGPEHGKMPDRVKKAVERLSNILDAYTDVGGNKPLDSNEIRLRSIIFECRGEFEDRMESETCRALEKGPVSDIRFIDAERCGHRSVEKQKVRSRRMRSVGIDFKDRDHSVLASAGFLADSHTSTNSMRSTPKTLRYSETSLYLATGQDSWNLQMSASVMTTLSSMMA